MNCNFYWQPACFQIMSDIPTNMYLDQSYININSQQYAQLNFDELKNKCTELELENSRMKQELALLKAKKMKRAKRIVKRRKQQELEKKFKCSHGNCKKEYASTLALNLHIKTKHGSDSKEKGQDKRDDVSFERNMVKQQGQNSNMVDTKTLSKPFQQFPRICQAYLETILFN